MVLIKKDSVFDRYTTFASEEDIPYGEEGTILPPSFLNAALDSIEEEFSKKLFDTVDREVSRTVKTTDIESGKAIAAKGWNVFVPLQQQINSIWEKGWRLGQEHALLEIRSVSFSRGDNLAEFADKEDKRRGIDLDPPNRRTYKGKLQRKSEDNTLTAEEKKQIRTLSDAGLNRAIEQRSLNLANDVDDSTKADIKRYIAESGSKISNTKDVKERRKIQRELEQRIKRRLGKDQEKNTGYLARAKTIAGTELASAYSMSRLYAFQQAGIKYVRWRSLEDLRICNICRDRNGVLLKVDDLLSANPNSVYSIGARNTGLYSAKQYLIPAHPRCRCYYEPVGNPPKDPGRDPSKRNPPPIAPGWIAAGSLSLLGILAAMSVRIQTQRVVAAAASSDTFKTGVKALTESTIKGALKESKIKGELSNVSSTLIGASNIDINTASEEDLKNTRMFTKNQIAEIMKARANGIVFRTLADLRQVKGISDKTIEKIQFFGVRSNINQLTTAEQIRDSLRVSLQTAREILRAKQYGDFKSIEDLLNRVSLSPNVKKRLRQVLKQSVVFNENDLRLINQQIVEQQLGYGGGSRGSGGRLVRRTPSSRDVLGNIEASRRIIQNRVEENYNLAQQRVADYIREVNNLPRITTASRQNMWNVRDDLVRIEDRLNQLRQMAPKDRANRVAILQRDLRELSSRVSIQESRFSGVDINLEATESSVNGFIDELSNVYIKDAQQLPETQQYAARFSTLKYRLSALKDNRLSEKKAHFDLVNRLRNEISRLEIEIGLL